MLEKYLTIDHIQLKLKAADWKEAIKLAADPLLVSGDIEEEYVSAMQDAVLDFGPYMVLAEGFALAHAKPSDLVHSVCISLITLEPPVNFGNKDFDPVNILIAFGTPDAESHIKMLRELAGLLNKPETFTLIRNAETEHEIISLFSTSQTNG
ncbi:MAG: PTS sugar transporter subunit IIA [Anaerolineaceae bacterium]